MPRLLADPVAAFGSGYNDQSIVLALDATDKKGNPIIAAIKPDQPGQNVLLSFYDKSPAKDGRTDVQWIADSMAREIRQGKTVYWREGPGGASASDETGAGRTSYGPIPLLAPLKSKGRIVDRASIVNKYAKGLYQDGGADPRGRILMPADGWGSGPATIELFQKANLSTLVHELGHQWLEELRFDAQHPDASEQPF